MRAEVSMSYPVTPSNAQKTACAQLQPLKSSCFAVSAWFVIRIHPGIYNRSSARGSCAVPRLFPPLKTHAGIP